MKRVFETAECEAVRLQSHRIEKMKIKHISPIAEVTLTLMLYVEIK